MKVAIITVNFNGRRDTLELLESLKKLGTKNYEQHTPPLAVRTIIVDNASTDGSVNAINSQYPGVDILQTGSNKGYAGGFNAGIEYAKIWGADYFLLINNDTLIKDINLLDELIKVAEKDPKIGVVSPKIYFAPGFEFHKDRYSATEKGKVIWYGGGHFDWDNIQGVHHGIDEVDSGKYDATEGVDFVSGACMLIKREVFDKVGVFNEEYFLYFEDVEFQKRVKEAGFKQYYNGKVAIYHKVSRSAGIGSDLTDYFHTRNRLIFGMKYGKPRTKIALLREALKNFILGRPAQRRGILDFYLGERRGAKLNHPPGGIEYQVKLSICIVSYNTADLTRKLLESIFRNDANGTEVVVLDNGSKDNCKEVIKKFLPKITYIQNTDNTGFSGGYNKAIRFSRGEYILLLNADVEVLKDSLSEMVKWADHFQGNTVLGGKLVFPDGSDQDSVYHLPTLTGAFKEYFLGRKGAYFMYQPRGGAPVKVEGLVMACFLIPRAIINNVGMLDEGTFIFFEDIEYCRRLKKHGVPVYFVPSANFIHHHGGATKKIGQEKAYSLLQEGSKHYHGIFYYLLLSWVLKIGQKLGRVKTPVSRWVNE
ncbi:MAG: Uncharacterized protein G01um10147_1045 [Microgenomates group bacterium Gr01-1014_7]|nr:MAG: Uncharacterized protein G01um10147_1045 [Microgenomates group bacterium Gr01-1014_7]